MSPGKASLNYAGKRLSLPKPDLANITVLTQSLPNSPVLPWNHYDSPWLEDDVLGSHAVRENGYHTRRISPDRVPAILDSPMSLDLHRSSLSEAMLTDDRIKIVQALKQLMAESESVVVVQETGETRDALSTSTQAANNGQITQ